MWKVFILLILPGFAFSQQGVAINADNSLASASAMLDVESNQKGFLLPRMTSAQRGAISAPEAGLLVFDTDRNKLFQFRNGLWRYLLDHHHWIRPLNRGIVCNIFDSIGIGTAAPTEKLHLSNGNFRILSGDIKLDDADLFINNTSGIVQFKAGGLDKAFMQLSGNNLRVGTNADNPNGRVLFSPRVTTVEIDNGNFEIRRQLKVTRPETGDYDLLPYCYGTVDSTGAIISGSGNFQVERFTLWNETEYRIRVDGIVSGFPVAETVIIVSAADRDLNPSAEFDYNGPGVFKVVLDHSDFGKRSGRFRFLIYKR